MFSKRSAVKGLNIYNLSNVQCEANRKRDILYFITNKVARLIIILSFLTITKINFE